MRVRASEARALRRARWVATLTQILEVFLGPDDYSLVVIPPGVWNGFKGMSEPYALVANACSHPHDPSRSERLDPFENHIPYDWSNPAPLTADARRRHRCRRIRRIADRARARSRPARRLRGRPRPGAPPRRRVAAGARDPVQLVAPRSGRHSATCDHDVCIHAAWYAVPGKYLQALETTPSSRSDARSHVRPRTPAAADSSGSGRALSTRRRVRLTEVSETRPDTLYARERSSRSLRPPPPRRRDEDGDRVGALFFLYGPGEDERRLVPSVITALLNGRTVETTAGDQVRDFLHVDDAAAGICAVATTKSQAPSTSLQESRRRSAPSSMPSPRRGHPELVRLGARPYPPGERMTIRGANTRLVEECGWTPAPYSRTGAAETIDWWRARRSRSQCRAG